MIRRAKFAAHQWLPSGLSRGLAISKPYPNQGQSVEVQHWQLVDFAVNVHSPSNAENTHYLQMFLRGT